MQGRRFRPTYLTYEAKVATLCRGGNVDAAMKVIEEEMGGHCVPNVRAYTIVLKGLCNERKAVLTVGYLKDVAKKLGCNADKETNSILIDILCHEMRYLKQVKIFRIC